MTFTASLRSFAFCLLALAALPALGEDRWDIFTYTAPSGWKKEQATEHVLYTQFNVGGKGFAQFGLVASRPGSGDPLMEFRAEWVDFVQKSTGVPPPVNIEQALLPGGWKRLSGRAALPARGARVRDADHRVFLCG